MDLSIYQQIGQRSSKEAINLLGSHIGNISLVELDEVRYFYTRLCECVRVYS